MDQYTQWELLVGCRLNIFTLRAQVYPVVISQPELTYIRLPLVTYREKIRNVGLGLNQWLDY